MPFIHTLSSSFCFIFPTWAAMIVHHVHHFHHYWMHLALLSHPRMLFFDLSIIPWHAEAAVTDSCRAFSTFTRVDGPQRVLSPAIHSLLPSPSSLAGFEHHRLALHSLSLLSVADNRLSYSLSFPNAETSSHSIASSRFMSFIAGFFSPTR